MRWLITGGCGFIGTRLVARLQDDADTGHTIRVLDNLSGGSRRALAAIAGYRETPPHDARAMSDMFQTGSVELIDGDVRDMALCLRAAEGADVIVHLAAAPGRETSRLEPRFDCETNVAGTMNMLEAARHADPGRFLFVSSADASPPMSPNDASKIAGEAYCAAYAAAFGVSSTTLRLGAVYGPGDSAGVVGRFIRQMMRGEKVVIDGDGRQTRDFVHIDDVVRALVLAARGELPAGSAYRVCGGENIAIAEVADLLDRLTRHANCPPAHIVHGPPRSGDRTVPPPAPAADEPLPGWKPETDFGSGIGHTLRWFIDNPDRRSAAA